MKGKNAKKNTAVENQIIDENSFLYNHKIIDNPPQNIFSTHTHNAYEIIFFVDGDASQIIENREYALKKNDLLIVKPFKYHYIKIKSGKTYERYNILFDPFVLKITNIGLLPENFDIANCSNNNIILNIFNRFDFYHKNLSQKEFADVSVSLIKELLYNMRFLTTPNASPQYSIIDPLLAKAVDYINDNLFTIKNIDEIAKITFISKNYLFKLFKRFLKTSPKQYIINKRLLHAQNLISLGESPTSVFLKCGFNDYSLFYRSFKQYFGYSPSSTKTKYD